MSDNVIHANFGEKKDTKKDKSPTNLTPRFNPDEFWKTVFEQNEKAVKADEERRKRYNELNKRRYGIRPKGDK